MTTIKLAAASVATVSLLLVAVSQRELPPDPEGQSIVAKTDELFDDRWLSAAKVVILIAALLDRAAVPPESAVKVVATETITPPAADPSVAIAVAPKPQEKHAELDTCQRHRMHKIFTHGGRSWRCRR